MTDDELKGLFRELREEMRHGNAALRQELRQEMREGNAALRQELRQEMQEGNAALRQELRQEMQEGNAALRQEIQQGNAALREEMHQEDAATRAETRHLIGIAQEANKRDFQLLAEGISAVREELDRRFSELDQKIDRTTTETHGLIKFLHDDLRVRVERLESTTH